MIAAFPKSWLQAKTTSKAPQTLRKTASSSYLNVETFKNGPGNKDQSAQQATNFLDSTSIRQPFNIVKMLDIKNITIPCLLALNKISQFISVAKFVVTEETSKRAMSF